MFFFCCRCFFAVVAGARFFFAVVAGARFFFCCRCGGRVFFFAVVAGGRVFFLLSLRGGGVRVAFCCRCGPWRVIFGAVVADVRGGLKISEGGHSPLQPLRGVWGGRSPPPWHGRMRTMWLARTRA